MSTPSPRPIDPAEPARVPPPAPRRPAPRPRRALYAIAALVVAILAYRWWSGAGADGVAEYVTAKVDRGPVDQTVTATGTVNPVKTVQVGTYVSGPILAIDVDFNSPVKKDQRVAKIDPATYVVKVRQTEAALGTARARVEKDRADLEFKRIQLERNRTLLGRNLIAQNDVDTAKTNYDQAIAQLALDEAGVKQAQANLDEAQVSLNYTDILSPVDGVVVSRNVDVGQTVAASFQTPTLFLIAEDLTKMQVDTNVSESDVGRIREEHPATFTVDAYPGKQFKAHVAQVRNAPVTVQNVVTYDVVLAVDNPDLELKPGMTSNVTITTAHRENALRLPVRALRFHPEAVGEAAAKQAPPRGERKAARDSTVYVRGADGTPKPVEVKVGVRNNQHAELLEGDLADGAEVIIGVKRDPTATPPPSGPPGFAPGGGRRF
jgi:HlyD family secretion protein